MTRRIMGNMLMMKIDKCFELIDLATPVVGLRE
jgi:hypothetical protein